MEFGVAKEGVGEWYPTVELGIGGDKVKLLDPPQDLIDEYKWRDSGISQKMIKNLQRIQSI